MVICTLLSKRLYLYTVAFVSMCLIATLNTGHTGHVGGKAEGNSGEGGVLLDYEEEEEEQDSRQLMPWGQVSSLFTHRYHNNTDCLLRIEIGEVDEGHLWIGSLVELLGNRF